MSFITVPFSWLLLTLYNLVRNYGWAVILFALVVKVILVPFQAKSKASMMRMSRLNPRLKELEKKHQGNKQKYQEEVSKLYRDEKINPMSGCIWSLIPFPILLALYSAIRQPLTKLMSLTADQVATVAKTLTDMGLYAAESVNQTYSELTLANLIHENFAAIKSVVPQVMDFDFSFWGMNLGATPKWNFMLNTDWSQTSVWLPALGLFLIPVLSGALAYVSMLVSQATTPNQSEQQQSMKGMMYSMPLVSVYIGFIMPAALGVYWIASNVFSIIQDMILNRHYRKIFAAEDAQRLERDKLREAELEAKRQETERLKQENANSRNPNTSKKKLQSVEKQREEERLAQEKASEKAARRAARGAEGAGPAQVGDRPFARGRAYDSERFVLTGESAPEAQEVPEAEAPAEEIPQAADLPIAQAHEDTYPEDDGFEAEDVDYDDAEEADDADN